MCDKIQKNSIIYKIEDSFSKKLRYNDKLTDTIRIQLKKEEKTFSHKTTAFHLTYLWFNWGLHRISHKIEDFLGKISYTLIGIQRQLSHN